MMRLYSISRLSRRLYDGIRSSLSRHQISSLTGGQSLLANLSGINATCIDMCFYSCMLFYGPSDFRTSCAKCGEPRYFNVEDTRVGRSSSGDINRKAKRQFKYIPIIPRLVSLYANLESANLMRYRSTTQPHLDLTNLSSDLEREISAEEELSLGGSGINGLGSHDIDLGGISDDFMMRDIYDSEYYKQLRQRQVIIERHQHSHRYLDGIRDILFGLGNDGFQLFKSVQSGSTILIAVNYNIPPSLRQVIIL